MRRLLCGLVLFGTMSSFAEEAKFDLIPKIESVEVQYYDQITGEDKVRLYDVNLDINGRIEFQENKGTLIEHLPYDVNLRYKDGKVTLQNFSIDAIKVSDSYSNVLGNGVAGIKVFGGRFNRIHDLIIEKYEERGHRVNSLALLTLFTKGEKSLFGNNDLKLLYGAEVDLTMPELVLEGMAGLKYKKISLIDEIEYRNSGKWNNRFDETTNKLALNYSHSNLLNIGLYYDKSRVTVLESGRNRRINQFVEQLSRKEVGLRVKFDFY